MSYDTDWTKRCRGKSGAALAQHNDNKPGHGLECKFVMLDELVNFDINLYWGARRAGSYVTLAHLLKRRKYVWSLDRQEDKTAHLLPRFFPVCLLPFCGFVNPRSLHSTVSLDFGGNADREAFKVSWRAFAKQSRDVLSAVQLVTGEWVPPEVLYQHFVTDWGTLARDLAAGEVCSEKEASR